MSLSVQSVLEQTFPDWEAIIIDDGSTDDTSIVAARFTDQRVRYIYQDNQGLSAARNAGIRNARGQYLAFLDADDEWYPQFLASCVGTMEANRNPQIVGVYTSHDFIDPDSRVLPQPGNMIIAPEKLPEEMLLGNFFPPCTSMVQTDIVKELGMFDVNLTALEDKDLWFRLSRRYTLKGIDQALARYRVYPGSMSTQTENMHRNRMAVLEKNIGLLEGDPATWSSDKKKAYGSGYLATALGYIRQNDMDQAWEMLVKSIEIWPGLLERVDTFYELLCDNQQSGHRGQVHLLDIKENGARLRLKLEDLINSGGPELLSKRPAAFGNLYLVLGMLFDQSGNWREARLNMLQAIKANPRLLFSPPVLKRFLKLCLGQRVVSYIKRLRTRFKKSSQPALGDGGHQNVRPASGHDF